MNKYELMFIIASDVAEEQREALIEKFKAYVEAHKGQLEGVEKLVEFMTKFEEENA